ncbi:hypothetical protein D3C72_1991970 [compost metagenome]
MIAQLAQQHAQQVRVEPLLAAFVGAGGQHVERLVAQAHDAVLHQRRGFQVEHQVVETTQFVQAQLLAEVVVAGAAVDQQYRAAAHQRQLAGKGQGAGAGTAAGVGGG